mgnify:FL=1
MNKQIVKALALKNFSEAKELVFKSLYAKSALALDEARLEVANGVFNNAEEETEETEETEEIEESNMKELDTKRQLKSGYFTDAKSRKAHVNNFYARKAKEKASRSPSEIEKDAKTDAYRAAYTKKTGKRVGRID